MFQSVETFIHKSNSIERFKTILRHELELKWIKRLQTPFTLGFNDNIYHEGNISKMPDFDAFSLLDIKKRNKRSHDKQKWLIKLLIMLLLCDDFIISIL